MRYKLYFDGSCKYKNDGSCDVGMGVVILDSKNNIVYEQGWNVPAYDRKGDNGILSNNVAEYQALFRGLDVLCLKRPDEISELKIYGDSKLVIEQVSRNWKIKAEHLKKYRDDPTRITGYIVDTTIFNENVKPVERKKTKFTFISPARMGLQKGTEKIWEALRLCKSDFEVIQIKWYDKRNLEEEGLAQEWINNPPKQITFIPIMTREELGRYMVFADAVLGQVSGIQADIERSGALCKKAVIHYANPKRMYIINGKKVTSPFLPHSNDPKVIAETIDRVVTDKEFREKLADEEYKFVMALSDPNMIASQWDELFEKMNPVFPVLKTN